MSDSTPQQQMHDDAQPEATSPQVVSKAAIGLAAFLMALPAAVPLLVIVAPGLVPFVGSVDTSDTGMIAFLVGMAFVLLIANWGFLYVIYRWLNQMAREQVR